MTYEEIEIGKKYQWGGWKVEVIAKSDEHSKVLLLHSSGATYGAGREDVKSFKIIDEKLPESGLLIHKKYDVLVCRTGNSKGYGFRDLTFYDHERWNFLSYPKEWRKPTKEETARFNSMLKDHANKQLDKSAASVMDWAKKLGMHATIHVDKIND